MNWPGEQEAWEILSGLKSSEVSTHAKAEYDSNKGSFNLCCLGQDISVLPGERKIVSHSESGKLFLEELSDYSRLSILRYLIHAKATPLADEFVRPYDLTGGDIFRRGTHVLPLKDLATRFDRQDTELKRIGKSLGGSFHEFGDVSIKMYPFPRVPMVVILWNGDDEFPAQASLLVDADCPSQLPLDIIWSTAMMTVMMILKSN
ncbi:MAG: DUF3786 domain-containing protein [Fibrobacteria bacterium]|nr:DUF3786 domain-containing protein [Fibrobacteria bacterium]